MRIFSCHVRFFLPVCFAFFAALIAAPAAAQMVGGGAVPTYLPAQRGVQPYPSLANYYQQPAQQPVMMQQAPQGMMQPMQQPMPPTMQRPMQQVVPPLAPQLSPQKTYALPSYNQQVTAQKIWQQQQAAGQIPAQHMQPAPPMQMAANVPPGDKYAYAYGPAGGQPQQQVMMQPQYAPHYQQQMQPPPVQPQYQQQPNLRRGLTQGQGMVERPLYEIGLGLAFGLTPAYPASEDTKFNVLPFPSIIYRGDVLRADREGARAVLIEDDTFEFGFSANASLPTDSEDVEARRGMPDLDFLMEIGPALRTTLYKNALEQVRFDLPLRAVLSIGGDDFIGFQGLILHPEFKYRVARMFDGPINGQFSLGPIFGLGGINDYFYTVDAKYATATRPAYTAEEGYMGTELGAFFSAPLDERFRLFTGSRMMLHAGAANEDSPLFKEDVTLSFLLGLSYSFYHSDEKVMVRE